jgi:hypothetical protein
MIRVSLMSSRKYGRQSYIPAAPLPPAPRQPMRSQDRGESDRMKPRSALRYGSATIEFSAAIDLHWGWITECLSKIPFDCILRREIDLLKKFRRYGYATSSSDPLQSGVVVQIHIVHVKRVSFISSRVSAVFVIREVLLQTFAIPICHVAAMSILFGCHYGGLAEPGEFARGVKKGNKDMSMGTNFRWGLRYLCSRALLHKPLSPHFQSSIGSTDSTKEAVVALNC